MDNSPLARLPPEIRNSIWALIVVREDDTIPLRRFRPTFAKLPNLAHTCRQIRNEALHLYYTDNTFVHNLHLPYSEHNFSFNRISIKPFNNWLRAIDPAFRPSLQNIKIVMEDRWWDRVTGPRGPSLPWRPTNETVSLFRTLRALHCSPARINFQIELEYRCRRTYQPSDHEVATLRAGRAQELADHVAGMEKRFLVAESGARTRAMTKAGARAD